MCPVVCYDQYMAQTLLGTIMIQFKLKLKHILLKHQFTMYCKKLFQSSSTLKQNMVD